MASKKVLSGFCPYCNQPVQSDQYDVEHVRTRRKTDILFHGQCHKRYGIIRFVAGGLDDASGSN